jgi:hypothetical protein
MENILKIKEILQELNNENSNKKEIDISHSLVEKIISHYDAIQEININGSGRDETIRLIHSLMFLKKDYQADGLSDSLSSRIQVLMASHQR